MNIDPIKMILLIIISLFVLNPSRIIEGLL